MLNDVELTDKEINLIKYIFEYVYKELGIKLNDELSISDKFNTLDKIIFSNNEEKKYEIYKVFYKIFLYFKNNQLYKFIYPDNFYNLFVDSNLFGIYNINIIKYYNCDYKDIVVEENKLKNNDMEKLKEFYDKQK